MRVDSFGELEMCSFGASSSTDSTYFGTGFLGVLVVPPFPLDDEGSLSISTWLEGYVGGCRRLDAVEDE